MPLERENAVMIGTTAIITALLFRSFGAVNSLF